VTWLRLSTQPGAHDCLGKVIIAGLFTSLYTRTCLCVMCLMMPASVGRIFRLHDLALNYWCSRLCQYIGMYGLIR
jgi:hypothetical protein